MMTAESGRAVDIDMMLWRMPGESKCLRLPKGATPVQRYSRVTSKIINQPRRYSEKLDGFLHEAVIKVCIHTCVASFGSRSQVGKRGLGAWMHSISYRSPALGFLPDGWPCGGRDCRTANLDIRRFRRPKPRQIDGTRHPRAGRAQERVDCCLPPRKRPRLRSPPKTSMALKSTAPPETNHQCSWWIAYGGSLGSLLVGWPMGSGSLSVATDSCEAATVV